MKRPWLLFWLAVVVVLGVHLAADPSTEPFFYNDETRHVMTGVFVRDAIHDLPHTATNPKSYAIRYYGQYPALGVLTWPPLFYGFEGAAMSVFGTSYLVGRILIGLFALLAGWYAFRLVSRQTNPWAAALAVALIGLAPVVYEHTRRVMLELPTVAFVLAAVFYFERYLAEERSKDAYLACLAAALAALTRFDAVLLIPFFAVRLLMCQRAGLLLRRPVLIAMGIALVLTLPYYLFTWKVYGAGIAKAAVDGTTSGRSALFSAHQLLYYPVSLPVGLGWPITLVAGVGLLIAVVERRRIGVYLALWFATYLLFTPMAELDTRHAIYWVPAVVGLAMEAVIWLTTRSRALGVALAGVLVVSTAWDTVTRPAWWLTGYEEPARFVAEHASGERPILMDGLLNGAFIYQTRRADPDRRLWILRGDKLLYSVFSDPNMGCTEFATTEAEVLALLEKYDPEFIVVEQPQLVYRVRTAELLRQVLRDESRFRLVHTSPIRSNHDNHFRDAKIEVYHKLHRNPNPTRVVDIPVLGIGGGVQAER